jgi:hypothetical protein
MRVINNNNQPVTQHRTHSTNAITKLYRLAIDCHDTNTTDQKINYPLSNCFPGADLQEDLLYIDHKFAPEQFRSKNSQLQPNQSITIYCTDATYIK